MGLLRTAIEGRKAGLICHAPGLWVVSQHALGLWVASQARQARQFCLGVLLHAGLTMPLFSSK